MGSINYRLASKRLAREVDSTGLFASSIGLTERFIKEESPVFWKTHKYLLKSYILGYGFWIWKADLIRTLLSQIPENEILLYMDAGSFVDTSSQMRAELASLLTIISKSNFGGSNSQEFREKDFCSSDLLNYLKVSEDDRCSNQFYGGFIFVRNCKEGRNLVNEWVALTCKQNHRFLIPRNFVTKNDESFVHHAYDQAIISCLLKNRGATRVRVGDRVTKGSIRLVRHRLATRYEKPNPIAAGIFKGIAYLSKLKNAILRRLLHRRQFPPANLCDS